MNTNDMRVLIADDEPYVVDLITQELAEFGAKVVATANNGRAAVEQTALFRPDVVLMDVEMPIFNGLAATRRIQAECPTPVVMLTCSSDREIIQNAVDAGAGGYLMKIPSIQELERNILIARARFKELMEMRHLNDQLQNALAHIKRLHGLLPICMYCHDIRDDRQKWQQIEQYISDRTEATFSHSICPTCLRKHHPELSNLIPEEDPLIPLKNRAHICNVSA